MYRERFYIGGRRDEGEGEGRKEKGRSGVEEEAGGRVRRASMHYSICFLHKLEPASWLDN